jgi:Outer membrane protein beta-barrel domain
MKILLSICFVFFFLTSVSDKRKKKTELINRYQSAERMYARGQVDSSIIRLAPYLSHRKYLKLADKSLKISMFRLAAQSYIILDSVEQAAHYMALMLEQDPYYSLREDDLSPFVAALDTILVLPRLALGFRTGGNTTFASILAYNSIIQRQSDPSFGQSVYESRAGWQIGAVLNYRLSQHLILSSEINFSRMPIVFSYSFDWRPVYPVSMNYRYILRPTFLEIPFFLRYAFQLQSHRIYLQSGGYYAYNLSTDASIRSDEDGAVNERVVLMNSLFKTHSYGLVASLGYRKDWGPIGLGIDFRYKTMLNLFNDFDNRYANPELTYRLYNVIDNFRLGSFEISLMLNYQLNHKVFKRRKF